MTDRQPKGTPIGGQFAASANAAPDMSVTLLEREPLHSTQELLDSRAMDSIALLLGRDEEWNGSADYLDEAARIITSTGRPNPYEHDDTERYNDEFEAYTTARDGGRRPTGDTLQVDRAALVLAQEYGSGADRMEWLAEVVADSGRPDMDSCSGPGYARALRQHALEQGRRELDAQDEVERKLAAGEYGIAGTVLQRIVDFDSEADPEYRDAPLLEPHHFESVDEQFVDDLAADTTKALDEIVAYVNDNADYFRSKGRLPQEPSDEEVESHIAKAASRYQRGQDYERSYGHIAPLLRTLYTERQVSGAAIILCDHADLGELDSEIVEPLRDRYEDRMLAGKS